MIDLQLLKSSYLHGLISTSSWFIESDQIFNEPFLLVVTIDSGLCSSLIYNKSEGWGLNFSRFLLFSFALPRPLKGLNIYIELSRHISSHNLCFSKYLISISSPVNLLSPWTFCIYPSSTNTTLWELKSKPNILSSSE